jgi:tRNA(Ile)-lysidine synthase
VTGQDADQLLERVVAGGLLGAGRPVLVMYSGGRDSTCLLELATRISGVSAVTALHVNYGLRDAADVDERHCADLCERLGVELSVRRPRRSESASGAAPAGNLQAWARKERYVAATELAGKRHAEIAAGHTATDQVETILYRLASSPSRRALLGMRPREGLLVRPLLPVTREQTAAYCSARGLVWRDDESNELDAFARSRIRRRLVPALEAAHPAAQTNVLALAEILRDEARVLDDLVDGVLEGRSEIPLQRLRQLPAALRRLVVQRLADEAVGRPAAGAARRADEVAALADRGTKALDLPRGVRAIAEHGVLRFARTPP